MRTVALLICLTALLLAWLARDRELAVRLTVDVPTAATNHVTLDFTPLQKK